MLPFRKILCPTDFSEPSYTAIDQAVELAAHFNAAICLLHVIPTPHPIAPESGLEAASYLPGQQAAIGETSQQLHEVMEQRIPRTVRAHLTARFGDAADAIVQAVAEEKADLIVIATHGLTGWRHLVFGSVTERVVQLSPCPVLTVHERDKRAARASRMQSQELSC